MSLTKVSYSMIDGALVNVLDYGADPTGSADSSSAITLADAAAVATNSILYFPAGTFKCSTVTLHNVKIDGVIQSTGTTLVTAVVLAGSIQAPEKQVFSWTATNPTNLPGTTYPFVFSATACTYGSEVNVKWFGAKGDNTTDDTVSINACATAMSFAQVTGTPYASKKGPVVMYFPRGNYVIKGIINITGGTLMKGVESGSNPMSVLIRDEVAIGSSSANSMIFIVKDNVTYTNNSNEMFFRDLGFTWRPSIDFASSTSQFYTSFIQFKASSISVKVDNCWFLGSPQKGAIFGWDNDYEIGSGGVNIQQINTGSDSDGAVVDIYCRNTVFDVTYGTIATVSAKGYGAVEIWNPYIYELWMGFCLNLSTNSANTVNFTVYDAYIYGMCVQLAPTYPDSSNSGTLTTQVWKPYTNMNIELHGCHIVNKNINSQNFCFTNYLDNSNMKMLGCVVDSSDTTALFATQMFKLDWNVNSLVLIGNEFFGSMTPNPTTITAPWPKAMISKLEGTITDNGITSILYLDSNKIDVGTMDYFLLKQTNYSQISNYYCCNNYINIPSTKFSFNTTGVPRYLMARNSWQATANSLEAIP
jgi:hypothetical protein